MKKNSNQNFLYIRSFILMALLMGAVFFFFVHASSAAIDPIVQCGNDPAKIEDGCTVADLFSTAKRILDYMFAISGVIAVGGVVYGGFLMVTSGGSPDRLKQGKKSITYAMVGLAIVLLSVLTVQTVFSLIKYNGTVKPLNPSTIPQQSQGATESRPSSSSGGLGASTADSSSSSGQVPTKDTANQVVALNMQQLDAFQTSFAQQMSNSGLNVVMRDQWGAEAKPRVDRVLEANTPITNVVIHHTADIYEGGGTTAQAVMKQIENYQLNNTKTQFADVGYHFVISSSGTIFQGRYGGPAVKGSHFHKVNDGSIGIALMGNFNEQKVSAAAQVSLKKLLLFIQKQYTIDFSKSTYMQKAERNIPNLAKHSDINGAASDPSFSTECPGKNLTTVISVLGKELGYFYDTKDLDVLALR